MTTVNLMPLPADRHSQATKPDQPAAVPAHGEGDATSHAPAAAATATAEVAANTAAVPLVRRGPVLAATGGSQGERAAPTQDAAAVAKLVINAREELITTMIAASQTLKGSLSGPEGVMVKGTVDGDIHIDDSGDAGTGTVVVSERATVNGMISGRRVIVMGTVNGPIISRTSLVISETGVVNGDVYYNRITNSDGGAIEGRLQRIKTGVDPLQEIGHRLAQGTDSERDLPAVARDR